MPMKCCSILTARCEKDAGHDLPHFAEGHGEWSDDEVVAMLVRLRAGQVKLGTLVDDIDALAETFYNASAAQAGIAAARFVPAWAVLDDRTKAQVRAGVLAVRDAILPDGSGK